MSQGERRLAAIMFTDMVGYTALTQSDERQAMEVLDRHNRLLRPFFPRYHGREVKAIGDSFLVEFDSTLDAVNCAFEIQRFLHDYNVSSKDEWKINLRIGIHLGDVIHKKGDVLGDAVNIASRIEPLAQPEGMCISGQVHDQVNNKVSFTLTRLGAKELKNVAVPVEVFKVDMPWERRGGEGPTPDAHRVAVLPLVNMISDPGDEYFADGMTEELISAVSKIPELSVISRTSVMQYKSQTRTAAQIGRELDAGTLLEGSVRKAGNRVRVAVQLIDAGSDKHMWAENYDRNLEDVFAIQTEIAQNVASALKVRLVESDVRRIGQAPTKNMEAYDLYLKGLFYVNRSYSAPDLDAARGYLEEAIQKDDRYAQAYAALADVYSIYGLFDLMRPKEAFAKSEGAARKAVSLGQSVPEAHLALSNVLRFRRDFRGALKEIQVALQLNPSYAEAYAIAAFVYGHFPGMGEEVQKACQRALDLDPLSAATLNLVGSTFLYLTGQTGRAEELYRKAIAVDPGNSFALDNLGLCHVREGRYEEGISEISKAIGMAEPPNPYNLSDLVYALSKAGRIEEARKVVEELVGYQKAHPGSGSTAVASAYAAIGEAERAMDWLEVAYEEQSGYLTQLGEEFGFEGMRSNPRFMAFLKKLGLQIES